MALGRKELRGGLLVLFSLFSRKKAILPNRAILMRRREWRSN
jgi:hypothetical protein